MEGSIWINIKPSQMSEKKKMRSLCIYRNVLYFTAAITI